MIVPVRAVKIICCILLAIAPGVAQAFSCAPLERNYYAYCAGNTCTQGYSVADSRAYALCGKLHEVRDIEPWMLDVAGKELARGFTYAEPHIFRLQYVFLVRRLTWPKDFAGYQQIYGEPKFPVQTPHLSVMDVPASPVELLNMRRRDEVSAERGRWTDLGVEVLDWSSLMAVLLLLAWSVRRYTQLVLTGQSKGRRVPLLVQGLVFTVSLYILGATWYGALFSLSVFLIPLIWIFQLSLRVCRRNRRAAQKPSFPDSTSSSA